MIADCRLPIADCEAAFGWRRAAMKSRRSPCSSSASRKSPAARTRSGIRAISRRFSSTILSENGHLNAEGMNEECRNGSCLKPLLGILHSAFCLHHSSSSFTPCIRLAGQPARSQPFHERIEIAIHDALNVAGFDAGAQVLDHPIRLEDVAANLVAP